MRKDVSFAQHVEVGEIWNRPAPQLRVRKILFDL